MAAVLQPYSTDAFNTLPDLHTAQESFVSKDGMDLVDNLYKPMIEKYQLEAKLGVGLLHRHFDLEGSEKLVEFNNISLPWTNHNGGDYSGGKILPNAWAVSVGLITKQTSKFLSEFMQTTSQLGLGDTLCLRLFPHVGFTGALELSEGRANINLSPDQVADDGWDNTTETMWFFEPEHLKQKRVCKCSGRSVHMHFHQF